MGRQLDRAPGERYRRPADAGPGAASAGRGSVAGPLARAVAAAVIGGLLLVVLGGLLSSTAGLLVVAGGTGAAIGLLLARAAVPVPPAAPGMSRRDASRIAIALALVAVAIGGLGTWLFAQSEGGVLNPLEYLWQTFGLLIPLELAVAALAAGWGASAGPVQRG